MDHDFKHLQSGRPYRGMAYRGSGFADERFLLHKPRMPGIFFSSDARYAAMHGDYLHECQIVLENPHVAREDGNDSLLDRGELIEAGFDGMIMIFEKDFFVLALHDRQVAAWKQIPKPGKENFDDQDARNPAAR